MFTFIKADFTKSFVSSIAKNNDTKTTVLGILAAALLTAGLDWGKLINGDSAEIGKIAGAVVVALLGYYTNKPAK